MRKDFLFGVSTSSYQIEGTKNQFKSIWDIPNNFTIDQSNGLDACLFVDYYKDDINRLEELGVDVYRMSISWARVEPSNESFSEEGIAFYLDVIKYCQAKGIKVDVTLYHWDMPQWLYEEGIDFSTPQIIPYFVRYAKTMIQHLDAFVHQWATFNEPWCVSRVGYLYGSHAPFEQNLQKAIQADYIQMVCHKEVYQMYKKTYDKPMGIVLNVWGAHPLTSDPLDQHAASICHQFYEGAFLNPLFKGIYDPLWIRVLQEQDIDLGFIDANVLASIKNQTDYLGINYYMHNTVRYASDNPWKFETVKTDYPQTKMDWEINPQGLIDILKVIRSSYTDVPIYITENGAVFDDYVENHQVMDNQRFDYIHQHVEAVLSISESLNIRGYYAWSLLDNFEWHFGYTKRFGLIYVDFHTFERIPKYSFYAYKALIKEKRKP